MPIQLPELGNTLGLQRAAGPYIGSRRKRVVAAYHHADPRHEALRRYLEAYRCPPANATCLRQGRWNVGIAFLVSVAAVKHEWLWRAAFLAGDNHRHRL